MQKNVKLKINQCINGFQDAKYIVRFDDICSEMNFKIWNMVEGVLYKYNIKPIIAVIPANRDIKLIVQDKEKDFWKRIQRYQKDGWMIGLHGLNHVYCNHRSGMLGISLNSEFVTLPYESQKKKLEKGKKIFDQHGINADIFVAPSHSFDNITLRVLRECNINLISDGHLKHPYYYKGIGWIPCQLWDRMKEQSCGIYTVCYHINKWTEENVDEFENNILKFKREIINPFELSYKPISVIERMQIEMVSLKLKIKNCIKRVYNIWM